MKIRHPMNLRHPAPARTWDLQNSMYWSLLCVCRSLLGIYRSLLTLYPAKFRRRTDLHLHMTSSSRFSSSHMRICWNNRQKTIEPTSGNFHQHLHMKSLSRFSISHMRICWNNYWKTVESNFANFDQHLHMTSSCKFSSSHVETCE